MAEMAEMADIAPECEMAEQGARERCVGRGRCQRAALCIAQQHCRVT